MSNRKAELILEINKKILDLFTHLGYVRGKIMFDVDTVKDRCLGELHRIEKERDKNIEKEIRIKEYL